jgi:hypothetical protein
MPSAEFAENREATRDAILEMWVDSGEWRAHTGGGLGNPRAIKCKVQWNSKRVRELYAGSLTEAAEVYLSRDESADATYPGVAEPSENSTLALEDEPNRPLIFKGVVLDRSPARIKIIMERTRRISTGGRA